MQSPAQVMHAIGVAPLLTLRLPLIATEPGSGGTRRIPMRRPGHVELPQQVLAVT